VAPRGGPRGAEDAIHVELRERRKERREGGILATILPQILHLDGNRYWAANACPPNRDVRRRNDAYYPTATRPATQRHLPLPLLPASGLAEVDAVGFSTGAGGAGRCQCSSSWLSTDPCVLAGTRRCRLHLGALTILAQLPGGYPRVLFCRSAPYTAIAAPPGPTAIIRGLPSHRGSAMGYCLGPVPGGGLSLRGG